MAAFDAASRTRDARAHDATPRKPAGAREGAAGPLSLRLATSPRAMGGAAASPPPVAPASDPLEREADAAADAVLCSEDPERAAVPSSGPADLPRGGAGSAAPVPSTEAAVRAASREGAALSADARAYFEPRFGRALGDVRVHADAEAAEAARSVGARAFTLGSDMVFGAGEYAPGTAGGRRLLAHELAHVVHHRAGPPTLRRQVLTRDVSTIAQYEWTGREQRRTTQTLRQAYISLRYDPAAHELTCTFRLRWRFPPAWPPNRRGAYVMAFERAVIAAWEGRFPLVRHQNGRPTAATARVRIVFDSILAPDMGNDREYINWLTTHNQPRWTMNVHDSFALRDNVQIPSVDLDPGANVPGVRITRNYTTRREFGPGGLGYDPWAHYARQGLRPSRGPVPPGDYTQTTSPHEFGHMLGLADAYVLTASDYDRSVRERGRRAADEQVRRRRGASNRIQNVGMQVTRDAYGPFADLMSTLTGEDWRVQ